MKISEYISELEAIKAEHGDLQVVGINREDRPILNARPAIDGIARGEFDWETGNKVCRV